MTGAQGVQITHRGRVIRLKWHRLRWQAGDAAFDPARLAQGLALGAAMEIDLRARADDGFAVLHDAELEGETTGQGPVAAVTGADLARLRLLHLPRAPLTSEELAGLMGAAHPAALLQFDMKNTRAEVSPAQIAHLARAFAPHAGHIILSGGSEALIADLALAIPGVAKGYDPTDDLVALAPNLDAMAARLMACLRHPVKPDMVYLNWELLLETAARGLDMVAMARADGVKVDAWTHAMTDPQAGFSDAEWARFQALLDLGPDQITTDAPQATEAAWAAQLG